MAFVSGRHVLVRQADAEFWTLEEPVVYAGKWERFEVPVGTRTDFASVPRIFVWLVPEYGDYTPAAVLHDHLLRVTLPAGAISALDADGLFRRAMRELGVPFLQRWFMWGAVRWAALADRQRRAGWLREAPRLLLLTLLALPIVAVPALAILLGLGLFVLAEAVAYAVRRGREPNRPGPGFTT